MAALEWLSPELQMMILLEHTSLESLHSHIRASPISYRVFRSSKSLVLSSIICRLVGPHVFHIAVAAAEASLLEPLPPRREAALKILERLERDAKAGRPVNSVSLTTSIELCRLFSAVEDCIKDFTRRCESFAARHQLSLHLCDCPPQNYIPLSTVESVRLRRAFFNLHLYVRLFYSNSDNAPSFKSWEPVQRFLPIFPSWQLEELVCVRDYVKARLSEIYELVEDDFVRTALLEAKENHYSKFLFCFRCCCNLTSISDEEIRREEKDEGEFDLYRQGPPSSGSPSEEETDKVQEMAFYCWPAGRFDFRGKDSFFAARSKVYHIQYMEHHLLLGLTFFRQLLHSSNIETRAQILLASIDISDQSLRPVLAIRPLSPSELATNQSPFDCDDADKRSKAWVWKCLHAEEKSGTYNDYNWQALRQWGYVFWDSWRLDASGILERYIPLVATRKMP